MDTPEPTRVTATDEERAVIDAVFVRLIARKDAMLDVRSADFEIDFASYIKVLTRIQEILDNVLGQYDNTAQRIAILALEMLDMGRNPKTKILLSMLNM